MNPLFLLQQSTHRMVIQYHPQIGYLFVPNLRARIPNELGGYYVRTNSLGFRSDVEFCRERTDRPRILFFGDSFPAGDGCGNSERFPELVGEALDAEVYNYGLNNSGTDQQLLIFEHFAQEIEADLIVLAIGAHTINRILADYRPALDRSTGQLVRVPKPYFALEQGDLRLHNVPVPLHRPAVDSTNSNHNRYSRLRYVARLLGIRHILHDRLPELESFLDHRLGPNPYAEYTEPPTRGWLLMEAILRRFFAEAAPTPVLLVPIPNVHVYLWGVKPIHQRRFDALEAPEKGVHVADVTSRICSLPRHERRMLKFQYDDHFSPFGHQKLAQMIVQEILSRKLLPGQDRPRASTNQKKEPCLKKPTYILGISCFYHNSAACLIADGEIIAAAEEERFTRIKNDRRFPHFAANYCLEEAGIDQHDLAAVVYYDNAPLTFERLLHTLLAAGQKGEDAWLRIMPTWVKYKLHLPQLIRRYLRYQGPVLHEIHHRSHAASAFYPSPFERAAILTIDGVGEWATATIGVGDGNRLRLLKEMHFPNSLGLLYSAFTQFLGFKVNEDEYKVMGLAPYGEPRYVASILERLVDLKEDGSVELNPEYFAFLSESRMTNGRFAELFGGPARVPESRITKREMDLARSVQAVLEEAVLRMAQHAYQVTGERKLCLAGGVALNCVANGRLLREGPFEDLWIQPAAGDAGGALGAALDAYFTYFDKPRTESSTGRPMQGGAYWGPSFGEKEIRCFLETHGYPHHAVDASERAEVLARFLNAGKVVGHFSGRVEFGPRALGARSILADARKEDMQVTLNQKIKYRESFRPFAPTVVAERVKDYFELDRESPYMLIVAPVAKHRQRRTETTFEEDLLAIVKQVRSDIPAVTHVDYSARVQTIAREHHPAYYDLVREFERLTGCGVVVNTSFNVRGEPIVCTPDDAYRCFMRTEMDVLILENCLLLKDEQPQWLGTKRRFEEFNLKKPGTFPRWLAKALRTLHAREFLPIAARLQKEQAIRVSNKFQGVPTVWNDCNYDQFPQAIFAIPPELDTPKLDPQRMAGAMTRFWTPGVAAETLRPILVKLLKLGELLPESELSDEDEQVEDSIYVMY